MSDITGSDSVGDGVSISYDVNPSAPSGTFTISFEGIKVGSVTLNSTNASATAGETVDGTGVHATITANWSAENVTYSVKVNPPVGKTKTYSGTLVTW
jgi:hypothetical protein